MSRLRMEVPPAAAGTRLDRFLADAVGSRAEAQRLIGAGVVRVDGRRRPKRHPLAVGASVEVVERADDRRATSATERSAAAAAGAEEPTGPVLAFAFEDEHLIVVDKPAGVVVHPGRGHPSGSLAQALAGRARGGEDPERAGIVHRLDRDTSGLLVVARSDDVHRRLAAQLARRELMREYLALVEGLPPARTGTIDAPLGRDRRDRLRVSTATDVPRAAITHFAIERAYATTTLLRVRLHTGRTHQIRAHLLALGHPVCGDPQYGGRRGRFGLGRQFLHAHRLAFAHPLTGAPLDLRSPLPQDLAAALALAERESRPAGA